MEWEWPSYIYDSSGSTVYAPSAALDGGYGVVYYDVAGGTVYGKLATSQSDPAMYFIITPREGAYTESEYGARDQWITALSALGVSLTED
jgi:hypothetical protein